MAETFRSAQPIWPAGREKEMNLFVGFRAVCDAPAGRKVLVRVAASTLYRLFVNGEFRGHGPARGPHGFYREDVWDITPQNSSAKLVVAIEVAGYNVNSFYVLDQPSFLQAEVCTDAAVLASTKGSGVQFEAKVLDEHIQKVQRYSFQRAFSEVYRIQPDFDRWTRDAKLQLPPVECAVVSEKRLIPRRVPYPDFAVRMPVTRLSQGQLHPGTGPSKLRRDRSLTGAGPQFKAFREAELAEVPSLDLQKISSGQPAAVGQRYDWNQALTFSANTYQIFDFGVNLTGLPGLRIKAKTRTKLYLTFDEMLRNGDVDFLRLSCVNVLTYDIAPGSYTLEAFEPYTLRYLKAMVADGECEIDRLWLREFVNPDVWAADFRAGDAGLNKLFEAGRETYRQNAVDVFMDCPSRERAGWLCDSYFTSRVEQRLSGHSNVEKAFLENYLLPERFEFLPDGMLPMCYPSDHNNGQFIPNWSLWFVLQLEEYLARSGDRQMVDALRPKVLKLFDYFKPLRNEDGLLEKLQSWVFIEWSAANKFTQDVNYPSNMLYAAALGAAGRIYGMPDLQQQAARIQDVIRKQSFDGEFFVDNAVRTNGKLTPTRNRTETCQYYAFYLGTASPETHSKLWRMLKEQFGPDRKQKGLFPEIHPANAFIGNTLRLELLSRNGLSRQLVEESRAYLLYMAERTGTLWEHAGEQASLNHGFASHVVNVLYRDVLGLYRVDPVGKKLLVRFPDSPLEFCNGSVPVPGGAVSLDWKRNGGVLAYRLQTPAGWSVQIENHSKLRLNRVTS